MVLYVTNLNETSSTRYVLSKQANFQLCLGPRECPGVTTEQLAKLLWRLVWCKILLSPLSLLLGEGSLMIPTLCRRTGQTLSVIQVLNHLHAYENLMPSAVKFWMTVGWEQGWVVWGFFWFIHIHDNYVLLLKAGIITWLKEQSFLAIWKL